MFTLFSGIKCEVPGAGIEATLDTSNSVYYYLQNATYSCDDSAAMVTQGSLSLQCQANGEWSDSPPVCGKYPKNNSNVSVKLWPF